MGNSVAGVFFFLLAVAFGWIFLVAAILSKLICVVDEVEEEIDR